MRGRARFTGPPRAADPSVGRGVARACGEWAWDGVGGGAGGREAPPREAGDRSGAPTRRSRPPAHGRALQDCHASCALFALLPWVSERGAAARNAGALGLGIVALQAQSGPCTRVQGTIPPAPAIPPPRAPTRPPAPPSNLPLDLSRRRRSAALLSHSATATVYPRSRSPRPPRGLRSAPRAHRLPRRPRPALPAATHRPTQADAELVSSWVLSVIAAAGINPDEPGLGDAGADGAGMPVLLDVFIPRAHDAGRR